MYAHLSAAAIAFLLCALSAAANSLAAEIVISSLDENGRVQTVPREKLIDDEITALELFEQKEPPSEIYLLAEGRPYKLHYPQLGNDFNTTMVLRYADRWELRWYTADSRKFYHTRRLTDAEAEPITELVTKFAVHRLQPVKNTTGRQIVGGVEYAFTYLMPERGARVMVNNPGPDTGLPADDLKKYQACVAAFRTLVESKEHWQVRYTNHRRLQVEHLFADPRRPVKQLLVKDGIAYVAIANTAKPLDPDQWFVLKNGELRKADEAPESLPDKSPEVKQTRLSADGRWLAGNLKSDGTLLCRNRIENTSVNIPDEVARMHGTPLYFLESHQAFIIGVVRKPVVPGRIDPLHFELFALQPATGELVTLDKISTSRAYYSGEGVWRQVMPDKLQPAQKSKEEVWMSLPDGRATKFGKYNTQTLQWVYYEFMPDMQLSPRDFFVDEQAKQLYFREDEQLLTTGLPAKWFE